MYEKLFPLLVCDHKGLLLGCGTGCQKEPLTLPVIWNYLVSGATKKLQAPLNSFKLYIIELFLFIPLRTLPFHLHPLHILPRNAYFWRDNDRSILHGHRL